MMSKKVEYVTRSTVSSYNYACENVQQVMDIINYCWKDHPYIIRIKLTPNNKYMTTTT